MALAKPAPPLPPPSLTPAKAPPNSPSAAIPALKSPPPMPPQELLRRGLYAEPKPPPTVPLLWPLHPEGMPAKAPAWTWKPPPPVLFRGGEGSLGELMNMVDVMAAAWKAKPPPPVPVLDRHAEDSGDDMDSLDAPTLRFGDASSVSTTTPCSSLSYWSDVESED